MNNNNNNDNNKNLGAVGGVGSTENPANDGSVGSADILAAAANREKIIVRTSIIGITTNVLLAAFKAA